jgi:excisionase family DNA binding protein
MTLEAAISEAVERAVAPLVETQRKLVAEIEQLRRALPAQLVTVKEAAEALGVHEDTIRRRIADGSLPSRRVGKRVRVDLSAATHPPTEGEIARLARAR